MRQNCRYILFLAAILFLLCPEYGFSAEIRDLKAELALKNRFAFVKGGCYQMGNSFEGKDEDEKPVHEVCVGDFYMGRYEVTVAEFMSFTDDTGYKTEAEQSGGCFEWFEKRWEKNKNITWKNTDFTQKENHPVVCVTWNDANEYVKWLSKKWGKTFRLPTEAEWEYAASGRGDSMEYIFGDSGPSDNIADETAKKEFKDWTVWEGYTDGFVYTAPVGSFKSNALGIYDLAGNVWEWCSDWYSKGYYKESPNDNPKGPEKGTKRVVRGGSWINKPDFLRVAHRYKLEPNRRYVNGGFRIVMQP